MDPTANLDATLERARGIIQTIDSSEGDDWSETDREILESLAQQANELAELVDALNGWITGGGFLPEQWGKVSLINGVTVAQAIVLGSKILAGDVTNVSMGGRFSGLAESYLYVTYTNDPFVLGIDREGRSSS